MKEKDGNEDYWRKRIRDYSGGRNHPSESSSEYGYYPNKSDIWSEFWTGNLTHTVPVSEEVGNMEGKNYMLDSVFVDDVKETADELVNLLLRKHEDYGPENISLAPGGPLNGLLVRLHDKLSRLRHLQKNDREPNHESTRDTYMDIANYAIIALMVIDGKWETA